MTKDGTIFLILTIIVLIQLATLIRLSNKIIYFKKHAITYECEYALLRNKTCKIIAIEDKQLNLGSTILKGYKL